MSNRNRSIGDPGEKGDPPPVPQAAPYSERFPGAARTENTPGATTSESKDAAPVPQGAPDAGHVDDANKD